MVAETGAAGVPAGRAACRPNPRGAVQSSAVDHIASRQNPIVRRFRDVASGSAGPGWMLLDGEHLVREALASGVRIEVAAFSAAAVDRLAPLASALETAGARVLTASDSALDAMSPVRRPSGLAAVAVRPSPAPDEVFRGQPALVLILDGVQDPGNVGAIVRAAEGCGATGLITAGGTADPFGWKALRGAMGSTFRLPIATGEPAAAALAAARRAGLRVLATDVREGRPLPSCDLSGACAVLLGGEGAGLTRRLLDEADERVCVPMRPPVESLNVAIAAALILYEAGRQRAAAASGAPQSHVPV